MSYSVHLFEFSNSSFVFAPARPDHDTIFCPFRFKSAVLVLCLHGWFMFFLLGFWHLHLYLLYFIFGRRTLYLLSTAS